MTPTESAALVKQAYDDMKAKLPDGSMVVVVISVGDGANARTFVGSNAEPYQIAKWVVGWAKRAARPTIDH